MLHTVEEKDNMTKTSEKNDKSATHVILVEYSKVELQEADWDKYLKPKLCTSLKEATDWSEKQIKKYPELTCSVYQLRTQLNGQINIKREDYSN